MRKVLKKGEITLLLPEGEGGGLSGEVHLVRYDNQKYVVRRCETLKIARGYEAISKKFEKDGFLPKFLGRFGKDVLYEYIEGRDLKQKESKKVLYQLGQIAAYISKKKMKSKTYPRFFVQLKELLTGEYKVTVKEKERMRRNKIKMKRFKPAISKEQSEEITKVHNYLKKKLRPAIYFDANDIIPGNFRIDKKGKVYFVDIEAIRPRIKGFGIAKFFLKWGKKKWSKDVFKKGYSSVASLKYLTQEYLDFLYLNFIIQSMNYKYKIYGGKSSKNIFPDRLKEILERYQTVTSQT